MARSQPHAFLVTLILSLVGTAFAIAVLSPSTLKEQAFPFSFTNGSQPQGGLISDANGNLYGTTAYGGLPCKNDQGKVVGCGTAFEVIPPPAPGGSWTVTTLYTFGLASIDGIHPVGNLAIDASGNLYGLTTEGGDNNTGAVFEISPPSQPGGPWTETTICGFGFDCVGLSPQAGLVIDQSGNLYGTALGGLTRCGPPAGCGLVFEFSLVQGRWIQTVLYQFLGGPSDGAVPKAPPILDSAGNIYGTTTSGGQYGHGAIFQLSPPPQQGQLWTETGLHLFGAEPNDGIEPLAGLAFGPNGTLAGTTSLGGTFQAGTVFGLAPPAESGGQWGYKVLYSFGANSSDGMSPYSNLTLLTSKTGTVAYGTTLVGGTSNAGTVFQLVQSTPGNWTETPVYNFTGGKDGGLPMAGLLLNGPALYGTTSSGGVEISNCSSGCGTVFRLSQ